jgi:hypothetical protein
MHVYGCQYITSRTYCTVLYCTVLYCTVLYCTVLYCTVLYCIRSCITLHLHLHCIISLHHLISSSSSFAFSSGRPQSLSSEAAWNSRSDPAVEEKKTHTQEHSPTRPTIPYAHSGEKREQAAVGCSLRYVTARARARARLGVFAYVDSLVCRERLDDVSLFHRESDQPSIATTATA